MSLVQTPAAKGQVPAPVANDQAAVPIRVEYLTLAALPTTDVLELLKLPANHSVVDWTVDVDDLDSNGAPAIVFKVGVLNAGKTDLDAGNAIWKTGLTTAQAGGLARMDTLTALRAGSTGNSEKSVGLIVTTAAATWANGRIGMTVWVKAD